MEKTKKIMVSVMCFLGVVNGMPAQTHHAKETSYPAYRGLVMAGYQGWFRAQGDGANQGYGHYGTAEGFDEQCCKVDIWPDVSEYQKTYHSPLKFKNGETAKIFSSYDKSTVETHFRWMKEYGIDGVFIQRFTDYVRDNAEKAPHNVILKNCFEAASKNNRAIAVMYDLSGLKPAGEDLSMFIEDWKLLVDKYRITNQEGNKTYLHHNGKPVVAVWGIGFPDRPYNIRNIGVDRFIDFLKNDPMYGGCAVMLGVPAAWRTLNADCITDPYLHDLIKRADLILPWTVQRFSPLLHKDMDRYRDLLIEDITWCRNNNVDYVPCVTPGFSWYNLSRQEFPDDIKPVGSIPRQGGRFFWQQICTAITSGAQMLYVAMFDEIDEGTAIFKVSNRFPESDIAKFIDNDGMPSDYYLWLIGESAKILRGEKQLTSLPVR